jgi:hypothetical protein
MDKRHIFINSHVCRVPITVTWYICLSICLYITPELLDGLSRNVGTLKNSWYTVQPLQYLLKSNKHRRYFMWRSACISAHISSIHRPSHHPIRNRRKVLHKWTHKSMLNKHMSSLHLDCIEKDCFILLMQCPIKGWLWSFTLHFYHTCTVCFLHIIATALKLNVINCKSIAKIQRKFMYDV